MSKLQRFTHLILGFLYKIKRPLREAFFKVNRVMFSKKNANLIFLWALVNMLITSCSGDPKYTAMQMFQMAYDVDPSIEEVRINDPALSIRCSDYPPGCVPNSGKRFKVRLVELIVVQYQNQTLAREAARKLGQYYVRNWLFDDVSGEAVLENFVTQVYGAEKPPSEK